MDLTNLMIARKFLGGGGKEDLNEVLAEQEEKIYRLKETLEGKAAFNPSGVKDVNFYDYDGTLLHAYTVAEAQELTELPELPTHEGLICQGWNYDLETIKSYNGAVDAGALYITDDGNTRLYITVSHELVRFVYLYFCATGSGAVVDWGDGSSTTTYSGTPGTYGSVSHTYAELGDYTITLKPLADCVLTLGNPNATDSYAPCVVGGRLLCNSTRVQNSMVRKVELGNIAGVIPMQCFSDNNNLETITFTKGITKIGAYSFCKCDSLKAIILPDGLTNVDKYAFNKASAEVLSIPDGVSTYGEYAFAELITRRLVFPRGITSTSQYIFRGSKLEEVYVSNGVTRLNNFMFENCTRLKKVTLPDEITTIGLACFKDTAIEKIRIPAGVKIVDANTFQQCTSLKEVTLPDTITTIGTNAFYSCSVLDTIKWPSELSTIGDGAFNACQRLRISGVPDGVTVGNTVFSYCSNIVELDIPEGKTSIVTGDFSYCTRLVSIKLPSSITSVSRIPFNGCNALRVVDFTKHTSVPTLSSSQFASEISSDYRIHVPAALSAEWKSATNWSSLSGKIIGV